MRVTIVRFKRYGGQESFTFPAHELTLLSGKSGAGKTTIFEAIMWCLYGGMRGIYPKGTHGTAKSQTCVLIELNEVRGMYIRRVQPPDTLEVRIPNSEGVYVTYTGTEAQTHVNDVFGLKDFFRTSGYIRQKELSPLITYSSGEKMRLIHQLTFGDEDLKDYDNPELYVNAIDLKLSEVKAKVIAENSKSILLTQTYENSLRVHEKDYALWLNRNPQSITEADVSGSTASLNAQLTSIEEELRTITQFNSRLSTLRQESERLTCSLHKPEEMSVETQAQLEMLRESLRRVLEVAKIRKDHSELATRFVGLADADLSTPTSELEVAIAHAVDLVEKIREARSHFRTLDCEYTRDARDKKVDNIIETLSRIEAESQAYQVWESEKEEALKDYHASLSRDLVTWEQQTSEIRSAHEAVERERLQIVSQVEIMRRDYLNRVQLKESYDERVRNFTIIEGHHRSTAESVEAARQRMDEAKGALDREGEWWFAEHSRKAISIAELENAMHKLHFSKDLLVCPHCKGSVMMASGQLTVPSEECPSKEECESKIQRIVALSRSFQTYENMRAAFAQAELKLEAIGALPKPPTPKTIEDAAEPSYPEVPKQTVLQLPPKPNKAPFSFRSAPPRPRDKSLLEKNLADLQKVTTFYEEDPVELNTTIQYMRRIIQVKPDLPRYRELTSLLKTIDGSEGEEGIRSQITAIERQITEYQRALSLYEATQAQISSLEEQIAAAVRDLPKKTQSECEGEREKVKAFIDSNTRLLESAKFYRVIEKQFNDMSAQREIHMKYMTFQADLLSLRQMISELASQAMEETVDGINFHTNEILRDLFEEDIHLELRTVRELKSKDTRVQVNININLAHQIYDSPTELSGGEQDRISLALMLAVAKISGTPLVLLDEAIASNNESYQEMCLDAIKQHFAGRTVINIAHNAIRGEHMNTIYVEKAAD